MKVLLPTSAVVALALLGGLALSSRTVQADPGAECRQEAEMYGIPPEQFEDYVDGCVLSRGGYLTQDAGDTAVEEPAADAPENTYRDYGDLPAGESGQESGYGAQ